MFAWRQTAGIWVALTLFGVNGAAETWQLDAGPPQLAAVPVPDNAEDFDCAYGAEERLQLLEKLNRCDRDILPKLSEIVVPLDWDRDETYRAIVPRVCAARRAGESRLCALVGARCALDVRLGPFVEAGRKRAEHRLLRYASDHHWRVRFRQPAAVARPGTGGAGL